ncbi:hypothetical protein [Pedobacter jamesrossensis]|uniref:Uncharacterized protein n=1 Tax=Pedobacter jamesrossensis TaxID=1908238 RepID=A0ABV8NRE3_9SPHI
MTPLTIDLEINSSKYVLTIVEVNGLYELLHEGRIIAGLRPPGEDWELLTIEDLIENFPLYEQELQNGSTIKLQTSDLREVIGKIEAHRNNNL